jgi:hypothetical protein
MCVFCEWDPRPGTQFSTTSQRVNRARSIVGKQHSTLHYLRFCDIYGAICIGVNDLY